MYVFATIGSRFNTVNHNTALHTTRWSLKGRAYDRSSAHNRHHIARPWGRGMGCLLWVILEKIGSVTTDYILYANVYICVWRQLYIGDDSVYKVLHTILIVTTKDGQVYSTTNQSVHGSHEKWRMTLNNYILNHVGNQQGFPRLRCGNIYQISTWYPEGNQWFDNSENVGN